MKLRELIESSSMLGPDVVEAMLEAFDEAVECACNDAKNLPDGLDDDRASEAMLYWQRELREALGGVVERVADDVAEDEAYLDEMEASLFEDLGLEELACRVCGCTESDCRGCIERTGEPCSWRRDLENEEGPICSACVEDQSSTPDSVQP